MIHPWFQVCLYWKKSVIWWHHFHPFIFSITELLFHGSTWSDPLCQGHCVYFTTLAAAIHYNKRSMVYLRKTIVALWICNHWISWHFFKKIKKWISLEFPRRLKNICAASSIYLSSKNHLQNRLQLDFQQMWKWNYSIICTDTDNYVNV